MLPQALLLAFFFQPAPSYAIAGTVVDSVDGKPLGKTHVFLTAGGRTIAPVVTGPTGQFRFDGLPAGKYSLSAERLGYARQAYRQRALYQSGSTGIVIGEHDAADALVFPLIPGGVMSGYVTDVQGTPIPGMGVYAFRIAGAGKKKQIAQAFSQPTDDRGYYRISSLPRGAFAIVVAGKPWQAQEVAAVDPVAYPLTFFPNTTNSEAAGVLSVEPGQETRADVVLQAVPAGRVVGQIASSNTGARRIVTLSAPSLLGSEIIVASTQLVSGTGFSFDQVPAGKYHLTFIEEGGRAAVRHALDVAPPETNVTVTDLPPAQVAVHVEFQGIPHNPTAQAIVTLESLTSAAKVSLPLMDDGTVMIPAAPAGRYAFVVSKGANMAVTSTKVRGAPQSDQVIEIPESGKVEVDLVVDASAGDLKGRVLRQGVAQAGILVMLVQRVGWQEIGAYRFDQSDSDGTFIWRSVPQGDYLMFGLEKGEPLDYDDPEVIRALLPTAQSVTVSGDPTQTVTLELERGISGGR